MLQYPQYLSVLTLSPAARKPYIEDLENFVIEFLRQNQGGLRASGAFILDQFLHETMSVIEYLKRGPDESWRMRDTLNYTQIFDGRRFRQQEQVSS